jgi:hypothetical protein
MASQHINDGTAWQSNGCFTSWAIPQRLVASERQLVRCFRDWELNFKEVTDDFLQPDYADPTSFHLSRDTLKKPRIAVRYFVFDLKTL